VIVPQAVADTTSFALNKLLPNTAPYMQPITDSSSTAKLMRPQQSVKYTPLQVLGSDMLVADQTTEDQCRVDVGGESLALRTV
jgi:hypothetical protein